MQSEKNGAGHNQPIPGNQTHSRRVSSGELLGTVGRIDIEHQGQVYRLIQTRQGKLILTK